MNKALEGIKKEIDAVTIRYAKLGKEIQELNALVVSKRTQHAQLIAKDKDTGDLGDEIVKLQTRLRGAQEAHKILTTELRELQVKKAVEERSFQLEKAELAGRDAMNATEDVFLVLVDLIEKTLALRPKARDFRGTLRPAHPTALRYCSQKIDQVSEAIERGLLPVLEVLPKELFADENLPKPDELKRRLKRSLADKNPLPNGDLQPPQNLHR